MAALFAGTFCLQCVQQVNDIPSPYIYIFIFIYLYSMYNYYLGLSYPRYFLLQWPNNLPECRNVLWLVHQTQYPRHG